MSAAKPLDLSAEEKAAGDIIDHTILPVLQGELQKPGWKTTEFAAYILSNALINLGAIDVGSGKMRGIFLAASSVGYFISRGLTKLGYRH